MSGLSVVAELLQSVDHDRKQREGHRQTAVVKHVSSSFVFQLGSPGQDEAVEMSQRCLADR
jgi:hypothetical protein